MVLRDMTPWTTVQGVLVVVHGVGMLIRGPSGSGKSAAALSLMRKGHQLISDDLVHVYTGPSGKPVGKALESNVRIEVRGLGIFPAESLFPGSTVPCAPIDLVVDLDAYDPVNDAGRTAPETTWTSLLGHELPAVRAPLPAGVDVSLLIELLAQLHKRNALVNT